MTLPSNLQAFEMLVWPGGFCYRHWSWSCGYDGDGPCQRDFFFSFNFGFGLPQKAGSAP